MKRCLFGVVGLFLCTTAFAANPLWSFAPLTATTISVTTSQTATIQYLVTNNSPKSHTLLMQAMDGINQVTTPGNCSRPFTLAGNQSCVLTLQVVGSELLGDLVGGPLVCQLGNLMQCYQPSSQNALNITRSTGPIIANITGSSNSPAVLTGTNMNWLGSSPSAYIVFFCAGLGCNINDFSEVPTGPITATSMETDSGSWSGFSGAICPAAETSYNPVTCSNIYFSI